jgi:CheY-like chemotaxis protein
MTRSAALSVALVARDRRFVRVASFLLRRHGYAVTAAGSPRMLIDLLERSGADVVVVDGSDSSNAGAQTAAVLATLERPHGLVVVGDSTDDRPLRSRASISKWSSFDRLLEAIEHAYRETHDRYGLAQIP